MEDEPSILEKTLNEKIAGIEKDIIFWRQFQFIIIDFWRDTFEKYKKEINATIDTIKEQKNLSQNPIPIGFIYVQLPNQLEPKILWATMEWKDVTSEYAGLFFRAEGKGAAEFGEIQSENSPRLTNVEQDRPHDWDDRLEISPGNEWSSWVYSGDTHPQPHPETHSTLQRFKVSGGEVRPRNVAMRIWKRIN